MTIAHTTRVDNDAKIKSDASGSFEKAWRWLKNSATAAIRDKTNYGDTSTSGGKVALAGAGVKHATTAAVAALGLIPVVGKAISGAFGLFGLNEMIDAKTARKIEERAIQRMKERGYATSDDLGAQYLALAFKGLSKTQLDEVMNALTDLRKISPQVVDALDALSKTKDPTCEMFLHAYTLYHAYHKAYYRARTGLDWVFAWHLAAEEVLEPLAPALRDWKEKLDAASDTFYQQTAFGVEGRSYHNTHCKHVSSGWFTQDLVGYCQVT